LWGFFGDRLGRERISTLIFLVCSGALLLPAILHEPIISVSGIVLVGFSFGGFLALYPALTLDYYGPENLGVNYGIIFTAYGFGGVLGPIMAGYFKTFANSYVPPFYIAGILALAGTGFTVLTKRFATNMR